MLVWMSYLVGLAVVVAVLTVVFGKAFGRGEVMPPLVDNLDLQELNSQAVAQQQYDVVRFDTVLRGYRQDQVDAVLEQLIRQLEEAQAELAAVNKKPGVVP
ncbi:DivIVA domain-containing protein [Corynebacterium hindlerae]|uniref:DivIVA domain-containing protein n=1 Tax=Corynebacterium hindlerae TaxID=699041 RepID=UPI0031B6C622